MRNKSGITLIELVVVISIIGILVVALGFEFTGWRGRSAVETETRDLYNDLMNARVKQKQGLFYGHGYFVLFMRI
jgi:prepilin-type N-terminal cleavage/methylation domain-containing protein